MQLVLTMLVIIQLVLAIVATHLATLVISSAQRLSWGRGRRPRSPTRDDAVGDDNDGFEVVDSDPQRDPAEPDPADPPEPNVDREDPAEPDPAEPDPPDQPEIVFTFPYGARFHWHECEGVELAKHPREFRTRINAISVNYSACHFCLRHLAADAHAPLMFVPN